MQRHDPVVDPQAIADRRDRGFEVLVRRGRDPDASFVQRGQLASPRTGHVGLVEDQELRHLIRGELTKHLAHRGDLFFRVVVGAVDDVNQEVGQLNRLQRGHESLDEVVRQVRDESDRVGEEHRLTTGELALARARVEGDEEAVLDLHPRVGDRVQHRGLAGVRVADEGHFTMPTARATVALHASGPVDLFQFAPDRVNSVHETTAVGLELGLARSPRADATGLLGQRAPGATKAWQAGLQECQFDLRFAFGRARVLSEDVEDHRGAVDRRSAEDLLQVALLGRGQVVFEHDGVGVDGETDLAQLLHFAGSEEGRGVRRIPSLHASRDNVSPGRVDEQGQFVELVLEFVFGHARELDAHEDDLLAERAIDEGAGYIGHASSHSTLATNCTGPLSVAATPSKVTRSAPPGFSTVTSMPHISSRWATATTAHDPVPQALVQPTPRSITLIERCVSSSTLRNSTFAPSMSAERLSANSSRIASVHLASSRTTTCGLPTYATPSVPGSVSPNVTSPMATLP